MRRISAALAFAGLALFWHPPSALGAHEGYFKGCNGNWQYQKNFRTPTLNIRYTVNAGSATVNDCAAVCGSGYVFLYPSFQNSPSTVCACVDASDANWVYDQKNIAAASNDVCSTLKCSDKQSCGGLDQYGTQYAVYEVQNPIPSVSDSISPAVLAAIANGGSNSGQSEMLITSSTTSAFSTGTSSASAISSQQNSPSITIAPNPSSSVKPKSSSLPMASTSSSTAAGDTEGSSGLASGLLVGLVIGALLILICIIVAVVLCRRFARDRKSEFPYQQHLSIVSDPQARSLQRLRSATVQPSPDPADSIRGAAGSFVELGYKPEASLSGVQPYFDDSFTNARFIAAPTPLRSISRGTPISDRYTFSSNLTPSETSPSVANDDPFLEDPAMRRPPTAASTAASFSPPPASIAASFAWSESSIPSTPTSASESALHAPFIVPSNQGESMSRVSLESPPKSSAGSSVLSRQLGQGRNHSGNKLTVVTSTTRVGVKAPSVASAESMESGAL
ncbi:hypothetical protein DFJ73DRAFT_515125 [Zopfochytrium polystomum]|nr:hypothetical protein DFJ73DRAFT_515125 [Zopfochytrium polystomum]